MQLLGTCFVVQTPCKAVGPPRQGGLAEVDRLLLDAHAATGEPDGLYAVARSHKLAAQLRLFEHEGAWSKALAARDLQLQSAC